MFLPKLKLSYVFIPAHTAVEASKVETSLHTAVLSNPVIKTLARVSRPIYTILALAMSITILVVAMVHCKEGKN